MFILAATRQPASTREGRAGPPDCGRFMRMGPRLECAIRNRLCYPCSRSRTLWIAWDPPAALRAASPQSGISGYRGRWAERTSFAAGFKISPRPRAEIPIGRIIGASSRRDRRRRHESEATHVQNPSHRPDALLPADSCLSDSCAGRGLEFRTKGEPEHLHLLGCLAFRQIRETSGYILPRV